MCIPRVLVQRADDIDESHPGPAALVERSLMQDGFDDPELYCDYLRQQVEQGHDPVVPYEFSWRFLRGVRARLTTERSPETSQHRAMRDAVVHTSGLAST